MKLKIILMLLIVLALAAVASAQTKISGTVLCADPAEPFYTIQVGDSPNHTFGIGQDKCKWAKPLNIAGAQAKELVSTDFTEVDGNRSNGYHCAVVTMTTGDKFFARTSPWSTTNGVPSTSAEKWTITGGTGKLKGIKGGGTLKWKMVSPDSATTEFEGEYELPK